MTAKPVVAVVGGGLMGASHARVIAEADHADLGVVVDVDAGAAERVAARHWARVATSLDEAMGVDAVVVASSTSTHLDCALPFIEAGIPTFVEKPLAPSLAEVDVLLEAAERHDVPLMCGFVERFNAAFRTARERMGEPAAHVATVRHSPPAPRIASSVVADLLLHDLDLAVQIFGYEVPHLVGASLHQPRGAEFSEASDCLLAFDDGMASLSANRMAQRKVRSLVIHTATETIDVDLLRQDVTAYRNVSQEMLTDAGPGYRAATEIDIPFVRHTGEPLTLQFQHFLSLVSGQGDHVAERAAIRLPHELMDQVEHGKCDCSPGP